ncbi:MAG TPA: hypothetical protein VH413_00885 [Verrucomicrobiae bacterium]|jgi:hypothetical protein|nr:hypothetical protein [Verrucomicrobiae bacterium]
MKTKIQKLTIALAIWMSAVSLFAQGTSVFTYQGQLHNNGTNANGVYSMIFALYDASANGNRIGNPASANPLVNNGFFTVNLDFGSAAFNGSARWLDITITNGGTAQTLSPRVQMLPTPYAQFATVAASVTNGAIMSAQLAGNSVSATNIASGQVVKSINGLADFITLAAGTNIVLSANGNNLQVSAASNLTSTAEGGMKIIRGIVFDTGAPVFGTGFSVAYSAVGSGGTPVANFSSDGLGDLTATGDYSGQFSIGQWIGISGQIYQISQITVNTSQGNSTTTTLHVGGNPGSGFVYDNVQTFPTYTVTFTTPFSAPPAIIATAHTGSDNPGFSDNIFSVNISRASIQAALTQFTAVVGRNDIQSGNFTEGFDFIAIGPQ